MAVVNGNQQQQQKNSGSKRNCRKYFSGVFQGAEFPVFMFQIHVKPIMSALWLWFEEFKSCLLASVLSAKLFRAQSPGSVIDSLRGSQAWAEQVVPSGTPLAGGSLCRPGTVAFYLPTISITRELSESQLPGDAHLFMFAGIRVFKKPPR